MKDVLITDQWMLMLSVPFKRVLDTIWYGRQEQNTDAWVSQSLWTMIRQPDDLATFQ